MIIIKNEETLKYELGVLMFNAYINYEKEEEKNVFDIYGNFESIINSLEINLNELKNGFYQEGKNFDLQDNVISEMFIKAKHLLTDGNTSFNLEDFLDKYKIISTDFSLDVLNNHFDEEENSYKLYFSNFGKPIEVKFYPDYDIIEIL